MDTILYVGSSHPGGDELGLSLRDDVQKLGDGSVVWTRRNASPLRRGQRFIVCSNEARAADLLRDHNIDALVVDTRVKHFAERADNPSEPGAFVYTHAGRLLRRVLPHGNLFGGIARDRVIGIVSADAQGSAAAFGLGAHRLGEVLVAPSIDDLAGRLDVMLGVRPTVGRVALCLAGGGIEGLLYEIGVMRALEAFMPDRKLVDLDLFCGISAGSMLAAFLANGLGPDEIARGLSTGTVRLDPIRRSDIFDPNVKELAARSLVLAKDILNGGGTRERLNAIGHAIPTAFFAGDRLRAWLERQLTRPGMSNRFDSLRRPLFVGATDQDTSQAAVFGEDDLHHVPIHRAVRASSALIPFYSPEKIDGRYYIDGAFSRTTNMRVAVRQGATLVILVDPLVPVRSEERGYVHRRGGVFGTMQGLKALINGRFDKAVRAIREMFPDVSFYLFRPEGDEMRMLSGSPMKYFYRREVEEIAFQRSMAKIRAWLPEMTRDFGHHGITFRDPEARAFERPLAQPLRPSSLGIGL